MPLGSILVVMFHGVVSSTILQTNGKDLFGNSLQKALSEILDEYSTDIVVNKLTPCANSQRNESLNSTIGSKNPKTRFYGGSESKDFQVASGVAQTDIGYNYIGKTLEILNNY